MFDNFPTPRYHVFSDVRKAMDDIARDLGKRDDRSYTVVHVNGKEAPEGQPCGEPTLFLRRAGITGYVASKIPLDGFKPLVKVEPTINNVRAIEDINLLVTVRDARIEPLVRELFDPIAKRIGKLNYAVPYHQETSLD